MTALEALARHIAEDCGRDWSDCGAYERQSFLDEAQRQLEKQEEEAIAAIKSYKNFYGIIDRLSLGTTMTRLKPEHAQLFKDIDQALEGLDLDGISKNIGPTDHPSTPSGLRSALDIYCCFYV